MSIISLDERLEIGKQPMAEAIAVELFLIAITGFLPNLPP